MTPLAVLVALAAFTWGIGVFALAGRHDDRGAASRDVLVLEAPLDRSVAQVLGSAAGVAGSDLRTRLTDTQPNARALVDRGGRILGWLAADAGAPVSRPPSLLLAVMGAAGLGLCVFTFLMARRIRRSRAAFAATVERANAGAVADAVTGLPNRHRLVALLDEALARRSPDAVVTFAVADLDHFRDVNDAFGQSGADHLLAAVGERLRLALPGAVVGRFACDEFAIILPCEDTHGAACAMKSAIDAMARPFWMKGQVVQVDATVGLAHAPADGTTGEELMRRAALARRDAKKRRGERMRAFVPGMEAALDDRRFIKQELRRALGDGALDLHYQPIVNAEGTRIRGVEALLRWNHPTRGPIGPNLFVPIAEQTGLMNALGEFVLRKAMADAMRWPSLYIAINVSPVEIRAPGFVDLTAGIMKEAGIAPGRVVIEVTEGVLIDEPDEAQRRLDALHALGVRLALDDFGVGYSSLSYLQRFPFDKLKIDKGFVDPLGRTANGGVIMQSIVGLGTALGLGVLAEGVETEEQRVLLRLAGCNEMQGFLFAKPAPRETIDELVAKVEARSLIGGAAVRAKAAVV